MSHKTVLLFLFLLCLPIAFATDTNSDANIVDANVSGRVSLKIVFEHEVFGGNEGDYNAWTLSEAADYAFEVDVPDLSSLYFLDFVDETAQVYVEGQIPDAWHPIASFSEGSDSLKVNNLLGNCNGTLLLLSKSSNEINLRDLPVGEWITLVPAMQTDYFVLMDADDLGICTFSIDFDEFEISASVNFRQMPSEWDYVEKYGLACDADSSHRCIVIASTGQQWDFDACIDAGSPQNALVGEGAPDNVCIAGPDAYNAWKQQALSDKLAVAKDRVADLESKSDPALAGEVADVKSNLIALSNQIETDQGLLSNNIDLVLVGIIAVVATFLVAFLVNRKALPIGPSHFNYFSKNVKEVVNNVREKTEAIANGKQSGVNGVGGSAAGGAGSTAAAKPERKQWWQRRRN